MAGILGVRRQPTGASPMRFEQTVHRQERTLGFAYVGPRSYQTVEHDPLEGFMPPARAAKLLQISDDELYAQVQRGDHEWRNINGSVFVRPALVSRLTSLVEHEENLKCEARRARPHRRGEGNR